MLIIDLGKKIVNAGSNNSLLLALKKSKYEKKFINNKVLNLFKGVYSTFEEAESSITYTADNSYDNSNSADMYKNNYQKLAPGDYPNIFWLSKIIPGKTSLFDFGGHIGVKYYNYSQYLDFPKDFKWTCYDLPAVVEEGRSYSKGNPNALHLNFADRTEEASGVDIFCAFGSLQYVNIELADYIKSLDIKPKELIITIPTTNKSTYYTVNSIGTAFCPYIIRNEEEFINSMLELGYTLAQDWDIPGKRCEIPHHDPSYTLYQYRGFLFK